MIKRSADRSSTGFPSIPPGFLASGGWRLAPRSPETGFTYDILVVGTF